MAPDLEAELEVLHFGAPLQYSCLKNHMDRGGWWAPVHGVAKSRTRLCNWTNWTEQKQKILRRGDKNTQKNCRKNIFMTQIITMVWSYLEPDILEWEVKWALEASLWTKLVEFMDFQLSYFKY